MNLPMVNIADYAKRRKMCRTYKGNQYRFSFSANNELVYQFLESNDFFQNVYLQYNPVRKNEWQKIMKQFGVDYELHN